MMSNSENAQRTTEDVDLGELHVLCEIALPSLRKFARNCPDCGGSGEVILHDETSEQCETCMALNDLIEYLTPEPPKVESAPAPVAVEEDDGLPF
jgi:hypothetical protein